MTTRDLSTIKPTNIDGIKRLATQIKKRDGIPHHQALDIAAKQAGFENFRHAQRILSDPAAAKGATWI